MDKMTLDFDFQQVMRLSAIRRWGIVEMSRSQSVAEHSYNVALIAGAISRQIDSSDAMHSHILQWALAHDLPEVVTGDIPSSLKQCHPETFEDVEASMFPEMTHVKEQLPTVVLRVVKVADFVDAIQFAQKFCVDARKEAIISEMLGRMSDVINSLEESDIIWGLVKPWLNLKID